MIIYSDVMTANFQNLQFFIYGDGVSNVLKINVSKPPFSVNFQNNPPIEFKATGLQPDDDGNSVIITSEIVNSDTILTFTFATPPPLPPSLTDPTYGIVTVCKYQGVP
jgi:hypothetical protein